jgi:hypothetical protein
MEERPPIWSVASNISNKQSRTADKGWSSSGGGGVVEVLTTSRRKKKHIMLRNVHTESLGPGLIFDRPKQQKGT